MAGWFPLFAAASGLSANKRSGINLNSMVLNNEYLFIDHYINADSGWSPGFGGFTTSTIPFNKSIDIDGNMIETTNAGEFMGGGLRLPGADSFSGDYVATWDNPILPGGLNITTGTWTEKNLFTQGTATIAIGSGGVTFSNSFALGQDVYFTTTGALPTGITANTQYFVVAIGNPFQISATKGGSAIVTSGTQSGTHTIGPSYTKNSNGSWNSISGRKTRIVAAMSGLTGPQLVNTYSGATTMRRPRFYRLEDEADFIAGRVYRRGAMQAYVNYNPGFIRFMDMLDTNNDTRMLFPYRSLPTDSCFQTKYNMGPRYNPATGTNRYAVADATATGGFPATPAGASPTHGEVIIARFPNAIVRQANIQISSISKASGPTVVTASPHGFLANDIVVHDMSVSAPGIPGTQPTGMTQLHGVPCKILTVPNSTSYTIALANGTTINSTGYGTFSQGGAHQYISMTRGSTGEYPIMKVNGIDILDTLTANSTVCLTFDSKLKGMSDVTGAWVYHINGAIPGALPLELAVKFMEELNGLKGGTPTDMWVNIPARGMTSVENNYSSTLNYIVNTIDVILNPSSTQRVAGWSHLTQGNLHVEHGNESWNTAFPLPVYLARLGLQSFPANSFNATVYASYASVCNVRDAKAAFPGNSRIIYVLGGQGSNGTQYPNDTRLFGGADYWTLAGGSASPLSEHDRFATASYFDSYGANGAWDAANINTMANTWASHAGNTVQQEADCAAWLAGMIYIASGGNQVVEYYTNIMVTYDTQCGLQGKISQNYEGGWNHATSSNNQGNWNNAGPTWNSNVSDFMFACRKSPTWGAAIKSYHDRFNSLVNSAYPSDYILVGPQYGHTPYRTSSSTLVDSYLGTVEGGAFDAGYLALVKRDNGLPYP